jgi:predicted ATP-grasp superfamily ATP-dependent carboligase
MKILITDGEQRSALAVTRSLGRRGHHVWVAGFTKDNLASVSRFCCRRWQVTDYRRDAQQFQSDVLALALEGELDLILPVSEESIILLNAVRDRLPAHCQLAAPEKIPFEAVANKYELFRLARQLAVGIPDTRFIADREAFFAEPVDLAFPVVVKPMASRIVTPTGMLHASTLHACSRAELEGYYQQLEVLTYPSLIQERITGPGTGLFTLFDGDRHLALFCHRRLREKPPSGGVSVVCESVPLDLEMVEAARLLLSAVGWRGVAMVEFKRDERDGRPKLMEINGRFWGSLQLAISAGIDFPNLLVDYLRGQKPVVTQDEYTVGMQFKWLPGTLDHLLTRLRHPRRDFNLPFGPDPLWRAAWEVLYCPSGTCYDTLSRDDTRPFLLEARHYLRDLAGRPS